MELIAVHKLRKPWQCDGPELQVIIHEEARGPEIGQTFRVWIVDARNLLADHRVDQVRNYIMSK